MRNEENVLFVFDEKSKKSSCCVISEHDRQIFPNQIFDSSECVSVSPDLTPCLVILNESRSKSEIEHGHTYTDIERNSSTRS